MTNTRNNLNQFVRIPTEYIEKARHGAVNTSRTWDKEEIVHLLQISDRFVVNSLLRLYDKQTVDEKNSRTTQHSNKMGFNAFDAKPLSGVAVQVIQNQFITPKQIGFCRSKLIKYAGQLTRIANGAC